MELLYNPRSMRQSQLDSSLLSAALQGLETQRQRIEEHIADVKRMLGDTTALSVTPPSDGEPRPRRKFSAATRRKMALAQRRRYAALRGEVMAEQSAVTKRTTKATKPAKRKISAQGLANIRAAVKKRWALAKKSAKKVSAPAKKSAPTAKAAGKKGVKKASRKAGEAVQAAAAEA